MPISKELDTYLRRNIRDKACYQEYAALLNKLSEFSDTVNEDHLAVLVAEKLEPAIDEKVNAVIESLLPESELEESDESGLADEADADSSTSEEAPGGATGDAIEGNQGEGSPSPVSAEDPETPVV